MSRASRTAGLGCGFFSLLTMCGTSIACYAIAPAPARDAAHGFLSDVRASSWQSALQRTSAEFQSHHDAAALEREVKRIPPLALHTSVTFMNATLDDDTAVLDGTLRTPDGEVPIGVELREIEGYWYIEQLVVQGDPLE